MTLQKTCHSVQFSIENPRKNVEQALSGEKQMLFSASAVFFLSGFFEDSCRDNLAHPAASKKTHRDSAVEGPNRCISQH